MRKLLIAANWKMHKTVGEACETGKAMMAGLDGSETKEVLICVPFTALVSLKETLKGSSIALGAQNMYFEEKGAFTGEVSPSMLKDIGVDYVIIGHSERRQLFGEDDLLLNKKLKAAYAYEIKPILCVGEDLSTREAGQEVSFVEGQLKADLEGLTGEQVSTLVIAYEPIWAIGTGKTASAAQAEEMCAAIRKYISFLYNNEVAEAVRIQYGGSVKGENAKEILSQPNIDGALVGGAALTAEGFLPIVKA